jgi:predicted DNA-binding protein YlxM (UPF0122 family)
MAYHKNKALTNERDLILANIYYGGNASSASIAKTYGVSRNRIHQRVTHGKRISNQRWAQDLEHLNSYDYQEALERLIKGGFITLLSDL